MSKLLKNCPRCNSKQEFNLRKRHLGEEMSELYIKCLKCNWAKSIKKGNSSIMLEEEQIQKLKQKRVNVPSLQKIIAKKRKKIGDINRKTM
jgi:RNase P subunit RPR2